MKPIYDGLGKAQNKMRQSFTILHTLFHLNDSSYQNGSFLAVLANEKTCVFQIGQVPLTKRNTEEAVRLLLVHCLQAKRRTFDRTHSFALVKHATWNTSSWSKTDSVDSIVLTFSSLTSECQLMSFLHETIRDQFESIASPLHTFQSEPLEIKNNVSICPFFHTFFWWNFVEKYPKDAVYEGRPWNQPV